MFSALLAALACLAPALSPPSRGQQQQQRQRGTGTVLADTPQRIARFCGDCHALPSPAAFPRDRWHFEVRKGYEFYARSGRRDLDPPPLQETLEYYRTNAAERLTFPQPAPLSDRWRAAFRLEERRLPHPDLPLPEIAFLRWMPSRSGAPGRLLACDMHYGQVAALDVSRGDAPPQILAQLSNPCHIELCDLDQDGQLDLLVADLGGYLPSDHRRGKVILLHSGVEHRWQTTELAADLGRVADARPADFDQDGDLDVVVAEFGWQTTGGLILLRNVTEAGTDARHSSRMPLQFERQQLDVRTGAIHVPPADLDGDGLVDFVALVSQEHETVEAFINRGAGQFLRVPLWTAADLTYGSSGIELCDLDLDGDQDVLYTNGDAWDYSFAVPSHGIQWLENQGRMQFVHRRLADLPGAYRALPGDLDGDGDLDIIAVAWLPADVQPDSLLAERTTAVLLLEQTDPGRFAAHTLVEGAAAHAALALADFDEDGDLDFATGAGPQVSAGMRRGDVYLTIWWNRQSD